MQDGSFKHIAAGRTAAAFAIVVVSASLGMLAGWSAPGIDRYARDWLMRARGPLPAPDDIAIVAIDEPSLTRFGRFPWARSLTARAIDVIAADQPKAIALDVLYTDRSGAEDDSSLARSIARAGNVVIAAQLVDAPAAGGAATWLLPLPDLRQAAAGVGHVNVTTESEGVARQILLREADDAGRAIRSMAIEAIRVGDGVPEQAVTDAPGALIVGSRSVPVEASAPPVTIGAAQGAPQIYRAARMEIDYIGPAGSFSPRTYSFAEVVEGRLAPGRFRGKYVLLGATAASLGDRLSSPFVHQSDVRGGQHGSLMPGVEVLANAVNTILRGCFYSETPDWLAFLCAALSAALTLGILALAQGRYEALQQAGALVGIAGAILVAGFLAFTRFLVFPPLAPAFVSFASAGMLGLLQRVLATSSRLDASIADVSRAGELLAPSTPPSGAAESVAHLSGAAAVAIFDAAGSGRYRFAGGYGAPLTPSLNSGRAVAIHGDREMPGRFFALPKDRESQYELLKLPLAPSAGGTGLLVLAHAFGQPPSVETLRICTTIAGGSTVTAVEHDETRPRWRLMPRGLEWKARALGRLNGRILERARFMDLALRSVEDGLLIAGPDGRITYANRRAAAILGSSDHTLIGRDLFKRLAEAEGDPEAAGAGRDRPGRESALEKLLVDRVKIECEIAIGEVRPRRYTLRMSAVSASDKSGSLVLGIVASLSDITRQYELQQTKNDVVALVSHEMRTPLTAIQGMSELLANYDVNPERRREMNLAINDEAKRLTRMIGEYLDIARLESGATVLRRTPLRVEALLDRTLMLLDPIAAERGVRLDRRFPPHLPVLFADGDLLSRAVGNLVSNAIKYSPPATAVSIALIGDSGGVSIVVADQGYGIPAADLERIFEKFYRTPRAEDDDVSGTGLGLALAREVAELHGGTVTVKSTVGSGSTFTLRIPRAGPEE